MFCGASRLAPHSLVTSGISTSVSIIAHVLLGYLSAFIFDLAPERHLANLSWMVVLLLQTPILEYRYGAAFVSGLAGQYNARHLIAFSTGKHAHSNYAPVNACSSLAFHFDFSVILSGLLRLSKILGFLDLTPTSIQTNTWVPSLLFVILGSILPQLFVWRIGLGAYIHRLDTRPAFASTWIVLLPGLHWRGGITTRLLVGAALFGMEWGRCGICTGSGAVLLGARLMGDTRELE